MSNDHHKTARFGAALVDLASVKFTPQLLRCVPADLARKFHVLPVAELGSRIAIATSAASDFAALDHLHSVLNKEIELRIADKEQLDLFVERFYGHDQS